MKHASAGLLIATLVTVAACGTLNAPKRIAKGGKERIAAASSAKERAQAAIDSISAEDEYALGEAVALRMIANTLAKTLPAGEGTRPSVGLELRDARLLAYVNHVGNLVALHGERAPPPPPELEAGKTPPKPRPLRTNARRFTFGVLDTGEVGAYSTPGGYVLITSGLLAKLGSESELAWVLGHEIAHVDAEDGLAALKADLATRSTFATIDEVLSGTKRDLPDPMKDPKFFGAVADHFYGIYEGTGLGRNDELRADVKGLEYALAAGYDGQGAARALEALDPGTSLGSALSSFNRFVTHGSKKGRLENMAALLDQPGTAAAGRYDREALAHMSALQVMP